MVSRLRFRSGNCRHRFRQNAGSGFCLCRDARFAFGGPSFSVNSARVGRDSFMLTTGFSLQITPDLAAYAYYSGELGRNNYDSHNIMGGVRASF